MAIPTGPKTGRPVTSASIVTFDADSPVARIDRVSATRTPPTPRPEMDKAVGGVNDSTRQLIRFRSPITLTTDVSAVPFPITAGTSPRQPSCRVSHSSKRDRSEAIAHVWSGLAGTRAVALTFATAERVRPPAGSHRRAAISYDYLRAHVTVEVQRDRADRTGVGPGGVTDEELPRAVSRCRTQRVQRADRLPRTGVRGVARRHAGERGRRAVVEHHLAQVVPAATVVAEHGRGRTVRRDQLTDQVTDVGVVDAHRRRARLGVAGGAVDRERDLRRPAEAGHRDLHGRADRAVVRDRDRRAAVAERGGRRGRLADVDRERRRLRRERTGESHAGCALD